MSKIYLQIPDFFAPIISLKRQSQKFLPTHRPHLQQRLLAQVRIVRQLRQEGARPVAVAEHHHAAVYAWCIVQGKQSSETSKAGHDVEI